MRDFVASPGSGLSDTRHAQPLAGPAGRARSRDAVVEGFRSRSRPARHHRHRRGDHRHGGHPATGRRRRTPRLRGARATRLTSCRHDRRRALGRRTRRGRGRGSPLVRRRRNPRRDPRREMAKACALEPTGMSAVLGGDEDAVLSRLEELDLTPANRNAAGQIVAAGRLESLEQLAANPPEKARVRALPVAGRSTPVHGARAGRRRRRGRTDHPRGSDADAAVQLGRRAGHFRRGRPD